MKWEAVSDSQTILNALPRILQGRIRDKAWGGDKCLLFL